MLLRARRLIGKAAAPAVGAAAAAGFTSRVIARMQSEYESTETLTPTTVVLLYSAYAAYLSSIAWAARWRALPVPLPPRTARLAGGTLALSGIAVAIAGAGRFSSPAQVSGIEPGSLVDSGIYRHTRNPQYLGLIATLGGLALSARSGLAALTVASAWRELDRWIPSEERHLQRIFAGQYRTYAQRTPRWL